MSHVGLEMPINHDKEIQLNILKLKEIFGIHNPNNYDSGIYVNLLLKSKSCQFTNHIIKNSLKKLSKRSANVTELIGKYEEIKNKNVKYIDSLVLILSRIVDDPQIISKLENTEVIEKDLPVSKNDQFAVHSSPSFNTDLKWLINRPHLSQNFVSLPAICFNEGNDLLAVSSLEKTLMLCTDLIGCSTGCNGRFINARKANGKITFDFSPQIDNQTKSFCRKILDASVSYSTVVSFTEEKSTFRYGKTYHALTAAMNDLIKEYLIVIVELEQQIEGLDLQTFWFRLQPSAWVLNILASLIDKINQVNPHGGSLLQLLIDHSNNYAAIKKAKDLYLFLIKSAFVPYIDILMKWISKGIIIDQFNEFFIEKKTEDNCNLYDDHSIVRPESIPTNLKQYGDKIYNTGKYLNCIRRCQLYGPIKVQNSNVQYDENCISIIETIEIAFEYASNKLVTIIRDENGLVECLNSISNYFLFNKGDFILEFMDFADNEMLMHTEDIVSGKLKTYFDLAVKTSSLSNNKYFSHMSVRLSSYDLVNVLYNDYLRQSVDDVHKLIGLESIVFEYNFEWPLNIILDQQSLHYYQIICRHILFCKYVERLLSRISISCSRKAYMSTSAWLLRYQMLGFIQNLLRYLFNDVIMHNWDVLIEELNSAKSVDEMVEKHTKFFQTLLQLFMINDVAILESLYCIMSTCIHFCNYLQECEDSLNLFKLDIGTNDKSEFLHEKINNFLSSFETNVIKLYNLIVDLSVTNQDNRICNLLHSLDFNSYFMKIL